MQGSLHDPGHRAHLDRPRNGPWWSVWWLHNRKVRRVSAALGSSRVNTVLRWGWRCAFLLQLPFFALALILSFNIRYTTPGRSKSLSVLKKIDWFGTVALLAFVLFLLAFLSFKFQSDHQWTDFRVIGSIALSVSAFVTFVVLELLVVPAPILAPFLLRRRIPILVSTSNLLIAYCNFASAFETRVSLTDAR